MRKIDLPPELVASIRADADFFRLFAGLSVAAGSYFGKREVDNLLIENVAARMIYMAILLLPENKRQEALDDAKETLEIARREFRLS